MDLVASLIAILSFTCALHSVRSYATLRPTLSAPKKVVDIYNLVPDQRLVSYEDGTAMQRAMFDRIVKHQFDEHRLDQGRVKVGEVLLLQHSPVYTLGSGTKATSGPFSPLTADGEVLKYDTIAVDRAGDATYHGPGQVVIYPVLDLVSTILFLLVFCTIHYGIASLMATIGILWQGHKLVPSDVGTNCYRLGCRIASGCAPDSATWLHGGLGEQC